MHMATAAPAPAPAPAPSIDTSDALKQTQDTLNESIKTQQQMMVISLQANTAMAYLQMALGISGKVAGR
jgi:hypothetical protein